MQNVLIIGHVWPEPCSSAAGARILQLSEFFLQSGYTVTFATAAALSPHRADLESLGIRAAKITLNDSSFDNFIQALKPSMVVFDRFMVEEQYAWRVAEHCPQAVRILDTEDLHCLRDARHRALKAGVTLGAEHLNSELAMREVAAILRCDTTLMISPYEIGLLVQHYRVPAELLFHLPFMLDKPSGQQWPRYEQRHGYISIGNFRHAPNWDAVRYLKQSLWPKIRHLQPDAEISVYGAYPPPKAMQLHDPKQGFLIKGWAEDALGVMQQAKVCLAPLRFGAGIKGKLIDAMLAGTPSVTTAIGAEGMHGNLAWPGSVHDDAQDLAKAAVALHESNDQWQIAQQQGLSIIATLYDKQAHYKRLRVHLDDRQAQLAHYRLNNFQGAMLRHHSLQSTRYMAQWIEAKNRLEAATD